MIEPNSIPYELDMESNSVKMPQQSEIRPDPQFIPHTQSTEKWSTVKTAIVVVGVCCGLLIIMKYSNGIAIATSGSNRDFNFNFSLTQPPAVSA